jgi:Protein of unknown function (DUF2946)
MDEIVKAALKKWPKVPHCYGWLALDARGEWYMRDDRTQAAGPFPQLKGSRILHDKLREFIQRNYACDEQGCWFFQNGPQRVYVELEAAPWVWRLQAGTPGGPHIESHTGAAAGFLAATLDEHGRLFLATELGLGLVHTLDMEAAADAIDSGAWPLEQAPFATLLARHGFVLSPAARASGASGASGTAQAAPAPAPAP